MPVTQHILFAGGGAPSQLNPGLSVAEQLGRRLPDAAITFSGPGIAEQRHLVRTAGYPYLSIPSRPTPRNPLQAVRFVTDNFAGYCSSRWLLREHKVSLVVGLGGYGSTPMLKAAACRGIPHILLEQNAVPSSATRWFSRTSALVCVPCDQAKPHLDVQTPVLCLGNPVAPGFEFQYRRQRQGGSQPELRSTPIDKNGKKRLVVLGGVGRSQALNRAVPQALKHLGDALSEWQIIHQTGEGQLQETEQRYQHAKVDAIAVTYVDELASVLFSSDLVICRAGGTTLAELALAGVPALLVPLADEDKESAQLANAKVYCAAGACRMVEESSDLQSLQGALATELKQLVTGDQLRQQLSRNIKNMARPQASAEIAEAICEALYGDCGERRKAA